MAIHKVTWFFRGGGKGWTESLWYNQGTNKHADTLIPARAYAQKRSALLSRQCKIHAIRISTEGVGPDALLHYDEFEGKFNVPEEERQRLGDGTSDDGAHPDIALLVRCGNADQTAHKHIFMRGIWDGIEDNFGVYRKTQDWSRRWGFFKNKLITNQWGWWGVQNKVKVRLASVARGADDRATFTFVDDLFPAGMEKKRTSVRVSQVNGGKSNLNMTHVVEVIDRKTAKTERALAVSNLNAGGFGAWQEKGYNAIITVADQKIVTRECGAPLLESVGRQKARARG